jgi:hypothetical protein
MTVITILVGVVLVGVAVWALGAAWHKIGWRWPWRVAAAWPVMRFLYKGPQ